LKITKAVIVAAGLGTRFLPVTKSLPKEMLPLVDKPLIQYAVEEAVASGIEQIILVTSSSKQATEDYFERSAELEQVLEKKGSIRRLKMIRELSRLADVSYVRQEEQLGLGHAVLTARAVVGEEPFAVMLPDDIIESRVPALKQMTGVYEKYGGGVIAVERVGDEDTRKYGIIEPQDISDGVYGIKNIVEKPEPAQAPSRLGVVGRYILPARIFEILAATPPGKGQEIQLTDALQTLLKEQPLFACEFDGTRYDTGVPLGWLKANVALALKHDDVGSQLREYLQELLLSIKLHQT